MSLVQQVVNSIQGNTRPGFIRNMPHHCASFFPRSDRLVVSFDNVGSIHSRPPRLPWGHALAQELGWSHLGCMTKRNDWFRHKDMFALFRELRRTGFFKGYQEVVFYGASMGGYAAAAFSVVHPGARLVLMSPQSSLRKDLVPFEKRFKIGRELGDWTGPWADAGQTIQTAGQVQLFYDPYHFGDARQAARFAGENVVPYRSPFLGHKIPTQLRDMGLVKKVAMGAIRGELSVPQYHRMLRVRRQNVQLVERVLHRAINTGHYQPALTLLDGILRQDRSRKFAKLRPELCRAIQQGCAFDWQRL